MDWNALLRDWDRYLPEIIQTAIALGIALSVALALHLLVLRLLRRHPAFTRYKNLPQQISRRVRAPSRLLLVAIALQIALPFTAIEDVWQARLMRLLMPLGIVALGWLLVGATNAASDWATYRYAWKQGEDNLQARRISTQLRGILRVVSGLLVVLTVIGVAMTIPSLRNLGLSLFASAGVAGIALGIAAQKTLSNVIAGIQLALTQPIRLDDAVVVEGQSARVEEIGSSFVVLRIWDDRRMIVPLSYFIETPFENHTHTSVQLTGTVMLYVDYTMPIDPIRREFDRVMGESPLWDKRVKNLQVTDMDGHHMEIRLLVSTANGADLFNLRCQVREKMIDFLQAHYPEHMPVARELGGKLEDFNARIKRA